MPLSHRENYLRTVRREGPEWIPASVHFSPATWLSLRDELEEVIARHPILFPDFRKGQRDFDALDERFRADTAFVDRWGCARETGADGHTGVITEHPLDDWSKLDAFTPPDPAAEDDLRDIDWAAEAESAARRRAEGRLCVAAIPHGHVYLRLGYLRGWENFLMDVGGREPNLDRLIAMVEDFNVELVRRWLELGPDVVQFADDLGMQDRTLLSPAQFRRYITPTFSKLAGMVKDAGVHTYLHSDGYVLNIIDQLLDWPIDVLNVQDLVNGIDNLAEAVKGRATLDLDVDRQRIVPFGTPAEIDGLIEQEVRTLGSPEGGLMLTAGIYPPTPPENIDALLTAFEKYQRWWWQ